MSGFHFIDVERRRRQTQQNNQDNKDITEAHYRCRKLTQLQPRAANKGRQRRSGTRGSWGFFVCFNWILIQFNQQRDATTMTRGRGNINVCCYGKMIHKWNRQSIIISLTMSRRSDKHQFAVHISRVLIFITSHSSAFDFRISFRFSLIFIRLHKSTTTTREPACVRDDD